MAEQTVTEAPFSIEQAEDKLLSIYEKFRGQTGSTIPILQEIEHTWGYLPEEAIGWFAEKMAVPESHYFGVATFYSQFHLKPRGKNIITCCSGTACHVKGSDKIISALKRELHLKEGEDTTADMEFTVETLNCVGACSIAPVVIVNGQYLGASTSDKTIRHIRPLMKKGRGDDE